MVIKPAHSMRIIKTPSKTEKAGNLALPTLIGTCIPFLSIKKIEIKYGKIILFL